MAYLVQPDCKLSRPLVLPRSLSALCSKQFVVGIAIDKSRKDARVLLSGVRSYAQTSQCLTAVTCITAASLSTPST
jgi:hypothetical protein